MLSSKKTKREDDDQEAQRLSSNQQKQQGKEESSDESLELSEDALFAKKISESEETSADALFAKKISESEETSEVALFAKKIDESESFDDDEEFVEDIIDEEAILQDFNLDSIYLYRAEDYSDDVEISKESTPLTGFFSPSYDYAADYHEIGSKKTKYNSIIQVTLSKPIGNILIELIKSSDAFAQNLGGDIKRQFEEQAGSKSSQSRVKSARKKEGLLDKSGKKKGKNYSWARQGAKDRSNAPNAVMIKKENDVVNIEITSRMEELVNKKKILVEHPLDKYVVSIERMDVSKPTKEEDLD
jgi:hypothetical protein